MKARRLQARRPGDSGAQLIASLSSRPCQCHNLHLGQCAYDVAASLAPSHLLAKRDAPLSALDGDATAYATTKAKDIFGISAEKVNARAPRAHEEGNAAS